MQTKLSFAQKARILWMTVLDTRTSLPAKLVLGGGLLYGVMPLDIIPDILPLIGLTDDAGILLFAFLMFLNMTKSVRAVLEKQEMQAQGGEGA